MFEPRWLAYLAIPAGWTVIFSLSNSPRIRRWRNLGWPACYVVGIAMLWSIGWRKAGANWLAVGLATGLLYFLYEAWATRKDEDPEAGARLKTILHGPLAWPIMLPELVEYCLPNAGVSSGAAPAASAEGVLPWELEDWLCGETAQRVLGSDQPGPLHDQLFREVFCFDSEYRNGGISQYFCNRPERWDRLVKLTSQFIPDFGAVAETINAVVADAPDPYDAAIERDETLGAVYDKHRVAVVRCLREIMAATDPEAASER